MLATLVLAVALPGQACNVRGTYQQATVARSYNATLYQQPYAAATYNQVYTQYIPVAYVDYNSIVGEATRSQDRRLEALKSQANLSARVDKLSASIDGLAALLARDAQPAEPQPQPVAPGKPSPQSPELPPVPKVNPDEGGVPPPPQPSGPGLPVPDATAQVLRNRCAACHGADSAGTSGGKFALFNADDSVRTDIPSPKLLDLAFRVSTGNMPKKSLPLPPDEQAAIKAWVLGDQRVAAFLGVKGPNP